MSRWSFSVSDVDEEQVERAVDESDVEDVLPRRLSMVRQSSEDRTSGQTIGKHRVLQPREDGVGGTGE